MEILSWLGGWLLVGYWVGGHLTHDVSRFKLAKARWNTHKYVKRFLIKLPRFILKFSNTMQEGRLTFVFLFGHVGRATATGQYNVQIGHSYPYGTQTGLTSPGLI